MKLDPGALVPIGRPMDEDRPVLKPMSFLATPEAVEALRAIEAELPEDVHGRASVAIRQALIDKAAAIRAGKS